ncbi:MAG: DUF89 family protein [PVC group bacterium]|nr:DUF89 family protein [PVC group bacterium]
MKTYLDCIPCFFRQALDAASMVKASEKTKKKILDEVAKAIPKFPLSSCPPIMGGQVYRLVKKHTKSKDPFKSVKQKSNKLALSIYSKLKHKVAHSKDRLLMAVELAVAGNIIDYGTANKVNVDQELKEILLKEQKSIKKHAKFFAYEKFKQQLKKSKKILVLGDNTGEIVFDRVLLEEIKRMYPDMKIVYAVRGAPVINDALEEDAIECGIDKTAEIISSGVDTPGTILKKCNSAFLKVYQQADMVISKGQGNFEALYDEAKKNSFFLFMAKCQVSARHIGCALGDTILVHC